MLFRLATAALLIALGASAQASGNSLGTWETRAPFPLQATEVSAAAIGEKIYAVCGITPDGLRSDRLFIYDIVSDRWSEGARIPITLGADHCNLAAAEGKLYLLGAIRLGRGFLTNRTYVYDPAADRWDEIARMTVPRGASGVGVDGNLIYVAGGEAAQESGRAFEVFDVSTRRWRLLPVLPEPRTHLAGAFAGGKFYAIGGRTGAINTVQDEVFEFDPTTETWNRKARMPTARAGVGVAVFEGRILVFGGEGPSGRPEQTYEQVEEYDPATDAWRTLAPMPNPRHGFYAASTGDGRIYLASGGPGAGATFSNTHDLFRLAPTLPPEFSAGSVVSAADFRPALAPGSLVSVFGARLSQGSAVAGSLPLPQQLNAVRVTLDGIPVALFFVSPSQINLLLPFGVEGDVGLEIESAGVASSKADIELQAAAPAPLTLDQSGQGQAAVLIAGTGMVAGQLQGVPSRPAAPGEVLEIFVAGLGAVSNPPVVGAASPVDPLSLVVHAPRVLIGGQLAEVLFAGLAPGFAGVYQINVRVPAGAGSGRRVELRIESAGASSVAVTIALE